MRQTGGQASGYPEFPDEVTETELDAFFALSDVERERALAKRAPHNQLGYAVLLTTFRYLGRQLTNVSQVPPEAVAYLADQLDLDDVTVLTRYGERDGTIRTHAREIREADGWTDFSEREEDLRKWLDARSWSTGDGPRTLFNDAVAHLRERQVVLPGASRLDAIVREVRRSANERLWVTLAEQLTAPQRLLLDSLVEEVPQGERYSRLERLRQKPDRRSWRNLEKALKRAADIKLLDFGGIVLPDVPPRRVADLAKFGLASKASQLRKLESHRRHATLLATLVHLTAKSVDDAVDMLDALISNDVFARAKRETDKAKLENYPTLRAAAINAVAIVKAVYEATDEHLNKHTGEITPPLADSGAAVRAVMGDVVPLPQIPALISGVEALFPPGSDDAEAEHAQMITKFDAIQQVLPLLLDTVKFDATAAAEATLTALRNLPDLLRRAKIGPADIDQGLLDASWKRLVLMAPHLELGAVDEKAYTLCVVKQFHRWLRSRQIFTRNGSKWRDLRAMLLDGKPWQQQKPTLLMSLGLPESPTELLAARADELDARLRQVAQRLPSYSQVHVGQDGQLEFTVLRSDPERKSFRRLWKAVEEMMPLVDLPEVLREVLAWTRGRETFAPNGGGTLHRADIDTTIAALLVAYGCNVGFDLVTGEHPALERRRLEYVDHTYFTLEAFRAFNERMIKYQASIPLAQTMGEGRLASIDGFQFIVPSTSLYAHSRHDGPTQATWLNMVSDQAAGLAGKIVAGTPNSSLYVLDVLHDRDSGSPDTIVSDAPAESEVVFGLLALTGYTYAPEPVHLGDKTMCRMEPGADYGPLQEATRTQIDRTLIERHWDDILRVVCSIHDGHVRAHDVIRGVLHRNSRLTELGKAIAHYGRIAKTLHILRLADEPRYRRRVEFQSKLHQDRQKLASKIYHGSAGYTHRYREGLEEQLGALGVVLNAVTLFNMVYMDAIVNTLRASGTDVRDEDVAQLSAYIFSHITMHGRFFFQQKMPNGMRPLRTHNPPSAHEND
ncbi:Tn3 family transposase [Streptomyces sp. NPDC059819]|uniref:Tn3 family transposase n=1 Tax=Streptomyces sp. NPDC059819 TaxID=3346963 RepID=UPI003650EEBE